jgi:hypothetical protein
MGSHLLNSGGLDDEIRVAVFTARLQTTAIRATTPEPGRQFRGRLVVKAPRGRSGSCLGQAVTGGLLFRRGRRLREVLSAVVVDPGLRPRFFSVFPTPANFSSR